MIGRIPLNCRREVSHWIKLKYTIANKNKIGSPHVHLVLWTGYSAGQLIQQDDLSVAQIPDPEHGPHLYELVMTR